MKTRFHGGGLPRRDFVLVLGGSALVPSRAVRADTYPSKPIRMVVPWPPGGGTDAIARAVSESLAASIGQPIFVDNRGGANGVIGSDLVAKSAPDGYTLMFSDIFSHVMNTLLLKRLPYDAIADFAPVTQITTVPLVLVAHPGVPASTVPELVQLAQARPGTLSYASFGNGSQAHIAGEMLKVMGRINLVHVPYKGAAFAMQDTLGGQVQLNFCGVNLAVQHARTGKVKVLAVTGQKRSKFLPDAPAIAETPGFEGFDATVAFAVWAPASAPPDVIAKLRRMIAGEIATLKFREGLDNMGSSSDTIGNTPEQMAATITALSSRLPAVVRAAGIVPE